MPRVVECHTYQSNGILIGWLYLNYGSFLGRQAHQTTLFIGFIVTSKFDASLTLIAIGGPSFVTNQLPICKEHELGAIH